MKLSVARVVGVLAVFALAACSKDDAGGAGGAGSKPVDASPPPAAAPKNLELAKAALVSAKAKYAKHEVVDADCAPIKSLEADFAKDTTPDAVKTTREIDVFCEIDVTLEGAVATLKTDNDKLTAAVKKKDHTTEQMYAATVKDGCESIRKQLETLAKEKLDGEPKVATLKAQVDPICSPPTTARKK
jgi:multidrug resistance efflux pump